MLILPANLLPNLPLRIRIKITIRPTIRIWITIRIRIRVEIIITIMTSTEVPKQFFTVPRHVQGHMPHLSQAVISCLSSIHNY